MQPTLFSFQIPQMRQQPAEGGNPFIPNLLAWCGVTLL
jgi:hypothetical protein